MAPNDFKLSLAHLLASALLARGTARLDIDAGYAAQRAYVATLLEVSSHLLVAASYADPEVERELRAMPEGLVIGFSVLGSDVAMRLRLRGGRLERLSARHPADLDIIFKHIAHAFMVLSFQETTAQAFANQRFITQGDAALSMRFTRCLNRMQLVTLPSPITKRAFARVPPIPLAEKLAVSTKLYARLFVLLARAASPQENRA
jgi:hypothetical protein